MKRTGSIEKMSSFMKGRAAGGAQEAQPSDKKVYPTSKESYELLEEIGFGVSAKVIPPNARMRAAEMILSDERRRQWGGLRARVCSGPLAGPGIPPGGSTLQVLVPPLPRTAPAHPRVAPLAGAPLAPSGHLRAPSATFLSVRARELPPR
mmetsp:Transcript_14673/g.46707  ORF Transcript_14673/g.46707 Transcript_14673/m.46707 type:complete len:150 (+) Transcript_14673:54-503(+)